MMPAVIVCSRPSGLPTASTHSPISAPSESPKRAATRSAGGTRRRTTATSLGASRPTTIGRQPPPVREDAIDVDAHGAAIQDVVARDDVSARVDDDARGGPALARGLTPRCAPPTGRWRARRWRTRVTARAPPSVPPSRRTLATRTPAADCAPASASDQIPTTIIPAHVRIARPPPDNVSRDGRSQSGTVRVGTPDSRGRICVERGRALPAGRSRRKPDGSVT